MKILVANFGSTSFKYRLFDVTDDAQELLGMGGYERVTDYRDAVEKALSALVNEGAIHSPDDLDAVGFKTVQGGSVSGCLEADDTVLDALEEFMELAPAHNRPYADGIRLFAERCPQARLAALFETAFYQWVPKYAFSYALPENWRKTGIRRYGFHGASHKFVHERVSDLMGQKQIHERLQRLYQKGPGSYEGKPFRVISCHLGGSSSVTAVLNGLAIGTSMGLSPQSGLPQGNRVGDLDSAAIPYAMRKLGISIEEAEKQLTTKSGLLGLSNGLSMDMRDLGDAASKGNADAQCALDTLAWSIRFYIGAFIAELGGLDALVFTAGIGENDSDLREAVCTKLSHMGLQLDPEKNAQRENKERKISRDKAATQIWIIPTNEEQVVAQETYRIFT